MKKLFFVVGAVFAILVASGSPGHGQGDGVHGCIQKNGGQLRVVSSPGGCRSSEIPIFWNRTGPQGPQGPAGPAGPAGSSSAKVAQGPRVYDAKGQFLGILPSDLEGYLSVFIPGLSRFISLSSSTGDLDPFFPSVYLYFEGENCTGNSYVDTNLRYQVVREGLRYIRPEDAPSECKDILSVSAPVWGGGRECRTRGSGCMPVLPYQEVRLPFILPVALPLSFEY